MQVTLSQWTPARGWHDALPAALDSSQTLVACFGDSALLDDATPVRDVGAAFPTSVVVGCSTAGEITGNTIEDGALVVAVCRFDRTPLRRESARMERGENSFDAGAHVAARLAGGDLRGVFILSDGLHVNGSELLRGVNSVLPPSVVVTGGLAGDDDRFARTWVIDDLDVHEARVTAVGFYGDAVQLGHGSRGGCTVLGVERTVTRADRNVLYELDRRPALAIYKEYLGDRAAGLPATALLFPLSIRASRDDTDPLVRTILSVDEATQSMTFAGDIPCGWLAQMMHANLDRLIDGAAEAGRCTAEHVPASGALAIAISCVGRRLVLGQRSEEELDAVLEHLPTGTPLVGFYSYGEISPLATGRCDLHNQTMTLTTLWEAMA